MGPAAGVQRSSNWAGCCRSTPSSPSRHLSRIPSTAISRSATILVTCRPELQPSAGVREEALKTGRRQMFTTETEKILEEPPIAFGPDARRQRTARIRLAWGTSLVSTVTTIAIQVLVIPLIYRSLGEGGYAAYAAITAAAGLIGVLNLGIGGSLVTPIAAAAAEGDKSRQAMLVQAGLLPLIILCLIGTAAVIPAVALLPLKTLLGKVGAGGSPVDLRVAVLIAVSVSLAAVPLSAIDVLRQAFQELHIGNLYGAGIQRVHVLGVAASPRTTQERLRCS